MASLDRSQPGARRRRSAFTLVELLVVVAMIAMLMTILLPSMKRARDLAMITKCLSQQRQLLIAWAQFPTDNAGRIPGAEDNNAGVPGGNCWVIHDKTPETVLTLSRGSIWPYVGMNPSLYKCPCDPRKNYIRTYAISTYLNGYEWPGWDPWFHAARKLSTIRNTSSALCFAEDNDSRGYTEGSFVACSNISWSDMPAAYHPVGMAISFADGHGMFYGYRDPDSAKVTSINQPAPNNPDVPFFRDAWSPDHP